VTVPPGVAADVVAVAVRWVCHLDAVGAVAAAGGTGGNAWLAIAPTGGTQKEYQQSVR